MEKWKRRSQGRADSGGIMLPLDSLWETKTSVMPEAITAEDSTEGIGGDHLDMEGRGGKSDQCPTSWPEREMKAKCCGEQMSAPN